MATVASGGAAAHAAVSRLPGLSSNSFTPYDDSSDEDEDGIPSDKEEDDRASYFERK